MVYQGLDYVAARAAMELIGIKKKARKTVFAGLRVMERAALEVINDHGD